MENRIDILNELKELSPTIAAIQKVNVFTVPEGYFEYLGADILMGIEAENGVTHSTSPVADVPAGYFDSLAGSILNKIKTQEEEIENGDLLAGIKGNNVYEVPQGYFDTLQGSILNKIKAQEEDIETNTLLAGIKSNNVYEVPQGYFDTLADSILAKIKTAETEDAATEIRALSPMLYSIQNENVFEVPQGYFKNLSDEILDKVKPEAKVIPMQRRSSNIFKYAVAAVFTGVMALGVFKFTDGPSKEIELPAYVIDGLKMQNVDQELASVSDADIVKYLEANGTDVKTAMVVGSTDNNELPSEEDYLLDEKALDKYLNSINVNDLKN